MGKPKLADATYREIVDRYMRGESWREIADAMRVGNSTILRTLRRSDLVGKRPSSKQLELSARDDEYLRISRLLGPDGYCKPERLVYQQGRI